MQQLSRNANFETISSPSTFVVLDNRYSKRTSRRTKIVAVSAVTTLLLAGAGAVALYYTVFNKSSAEPVHKVTIGDQSVPLQEGLTELPFSNQGELYVLFQQSTGAEVFHDIPAGRSHDGNNWEPVYPLLFKFDCSSSSKKCTVRIPKDGGNYIIVPIKGSTRSDRMLASDFLIQSTFGPTRNLLSSFPSTGSFQDRAKTFIQQQMSTPATLHREYYRLKTNPIISSYAADRTAQVNRSGSAIGPCEKYSRWSMAAFDGGDAVAPKPVTLNGNLLYVNNDLRTEVSTEFAQALQKVGPSPWVICEFWSYSSQVGGRIGFQSANGASSCVGLNHPALSFKTRTPDTSKVLFRNAQFIPLQPVIPDSVLLANNAGCATRESANLFAQDSSGTWYRYQARLRLLDNTPSQPFLNRKSSYESSYPGSSDPNVPKTFLNDEQCVIVVNSGKFSVSEICGSPGEISNDPAQGNRFSLSGSISTYVESLDLYRNGHIQGTSKYNVWANIALKAKDQLRQRVAWALAQIWVVSESGVNLGHVNEMWVNYYDIFVRNAFGNYLDIMKEVSYSPMMAHMLSFLDSISYESTVETRGYGKFPDENYARELMQLFSIGLWKLNRNGTQIRDGTGNAVQSYKITDIMDFARVWTGFQRIFKRGNIEQLSDFTDNYIDPMQIRGEAHDSYPKQGLDKFHIGDEYPLCSSLPPRAFLRQGAKYRFLGTNQYAPEIAQKWSRLDLNPSSSLLHTKLCNAAPGGACQLKSVVYLDKTVECSGVECTVDTVGTVGVKVTSSDYVFYEYVREPCVELEFPTNGKVTIGNNGQKPLCVDEKSTRGWAMCCSSDGRNFVDRKSYDGEVTSYATALSRCSSAGLTLCASNSSWSGNDDYRRPWTRTGCSVKAQVFSDGRISLVNAIPVNAGTSLFVGLKASSGVKIRVNWESGSFPSVDNSCSNVCEVVDNSCVCNTVVSTSSVFTDSKVIPSAAEVLEKLSIGSVAPDGSFKLFNENLNQGLRIYVDGTGQFNEKTIFEISSEGSRVRYFANIRSSVQISNRFRFRNPPNFMLHEERTFRDASNEVDAVLKHLFYHPNTAPFVADFMIKRFVSSNPSPAYVEAVANAFTSGSYAGFGKGKYGDLSATTAAVLLYRDSLSAPLKLDSTHGQIREPLMKLIHYMRALEVTVKYDREIDFRNLDRIGQQPHASPSVFNFYQSEFQATGAVANLRLRSPEAQILDTPKLMSYMNMMISLVENGLTNCRNGFGNGLPGEDCSPINRGQSSMSNGFGGSLNVSTMFGNVRSADLINELDVLLTGGRLDVKRKEILSQAFDGVYQKTNSEAKSVRSVAELFALTPEFQVTSRDQSRNITRKLSSKGGRTSDDYQAVVLVFLEGGADSFNLLVPHSQCASGDLYQEYRMIRGLAAMNLNELLPINVPSWGTSQPCQTYGVLGKMPFLKSLYTDQDALFISNIGTLVEPVTFNEYRSGTKRLPIDLFAHNIQQNVIKSCDARTMSAKGVLGRIQDALTKQGHKVDAFSTKGYTNTLEGAPGVSEGQQIVDGSSGVTQFDQEGLNPYLRDYVLSLTGNISSSIMSDTWSNLVKIGIERNQGLSQVLKSVSIGNNLAQLKSGLGQQFSQIARLIAARTQLKPSKNLFYASIDGFDTHGSHTDFGNNMADVDQSLKEFVTELKAQGVWNKVTIAFVSDFARTLGSNGAGTDHAWGGNTFVVGGSVKGGQILGKYPAKLGEDGDLNIGNGRLIPTTPFEAMWNGISQWLGVEESSMDTVLPNRPNFMSGNYLFTKQMLFK